MSTLLQIPTPAPGTFEPWLWDAMLVVAILSAVLFAWNQGKEAFGRRPPFDQELDENREEMAKIAKEIGDLQKVVIGSATKVEVIAAEKALEEKMEQRFNGLDEKRREDIGDLHHKIESTKDLITAQVEDKARETRGAIATMQQQIISVLTSGRKG